MIKARNISANKLMIIAFTILLPVNFLAMICVGWNDQGTMANGFIVSASRGILSIILFPMHMVESFRTDPFADVLFFVGDIICITLWALLFVFIYRYIQKKVQKPVVKKRA